MTSKDYDLSGKVAVVTGAGRGIGRAIASGFARAGASVVFAARTTSEIEKAAAEAVANGGKAIAVPCDVTDEEAVNALFRRAAEALGGVDVAVLNAGANYDREPVEVSDPMNWGRTLDLNLTGAYLCARAAIPYLKLRGGGKIITVGSGLGHRGVPANAAYACSKAGLWMLTRVLAQELWQYNISVNELIPGPVETAIDDGQTKNAVNQIGSEWVKQPEDVVPLALFLACQPVIGPTAQSFSLMRRDT